MCIDLVHMVVCVCVCVSGTYYSSILYSVNINFFGKHLRKGTEFGSYNDAIVIAI